MSIKPLPNNSDAETAVIACCLDSFEAISQCQEFGLASQDFYDSRMQWLWENINRQEQRVDLITFVEGLQNEKIFKMMGGVAFLMRLQAQAPSIPQLPEWLGILREKSILRQIIIRGRELEQWAFERNDPYKLLDEVERHILAIRPSERVIDETMTSLVVKAINRIEAKILSQGITGLSTGLMDLDKITDGLHAGEMVVVAAYPGCGKSALAGGIIAHNVLRGVPAAIFTAEMQPDQFVCRMLASEARVNLKHVYQHDIEKLVPVAARLAKTKTHIRNISGQTIGQVIAQARRIKQKHNIQLAAIDYLQLLSCPGKETREQEVSAISKGVKQIAMELQIPVLALSQLNDDGKLRESRAIGQDADSIWKLEPEEGTSKVKIRISKNRDGETGAVEATFLKPYTRYENVKTETRDYTPNS